ncbi:hypothetical protein GWI33_012721 [Rhynchophorus ferrugineus]|uniref:Carboxylic ester hydrolase n=1 Tax=Rhynchophorus ferrugineus TaxID=354439 RepID=A0A834I7T5_RHYFE|nr:hypothetical protein GWI33_012721 [Rhynchophorus ferrugineus]
MNNMPALGFLILLAGAFAQELTVTLPDGAVKGVQRVTTAGHPYYAFFSIRYAKPPVGALRFQTPVPVDPWNVVYDATFEKNVCYQVSFDVKEENEDCLTVSVYTPINPLTTKNKLPVMVYIHGGGFVVGSGRYTGNLHGASPGYIIDNQLIMVSINYRLGPFGFLSTGDKVIPGNAGLKDQTLALKWVQKNIAFFGGDPDKVTLFGQSAGGASIGYLILSPSAARLFRAAILESGTPLCPWAYQRNQTEITYKTASFIDQRFNHQRDAQELLTFLQKVDAKTIDNASNRYTVWATTPAETGHNSIINGQLEQGFFFAPVVEVEHDGAFLTQKPYEALARGNFNKVPIIIGACSEEGLMSLSPKLKSIFSVYDSNPSFLVPQGMHITNSSTKSYAGSLIKAQYSPNSEMKNNILSGIQYYTDQNFVKSLIKHAELQSQHTDVYFYVFSYSGPLGGNVHNKYPGSGNVTHVEEANYILDRLNVKLFPPADQLVHQRIVKLWTNFAIHKNPTPTQDPLLQNIMWPKVSQANFQYLDIGANLQILKDPKKEKYNFWKTLYEMFGERPFDTY